MSKKVKGEALDVSKDLEKLNSEDFKKTPDIKEIYKVTYQELTSQQTKRDTVFGVFITLFTLLFHYHLQMIYLHSKDRGY